MSTERPLLRLKGHELVPPDEDRRVAIDVFDVLLPCRNYEVKYKVASLGLVSPTLEFLLRLVKAAPGISDTEVGEFFGYSATEMAYVLEEAVGPGYIERRSGKLWLTISGDTLFREGEKEPTIYKVESRRRTFGFDLMSISPQSKRMLDLLESSLPELPSVDPAATGRVAERLPDRFKYFFRELADQGDRGKLERRDIYSIDPTVRAGERFQVPIRVQIYSHASSPSAVEIDLSSWRPEHEISDRPEIERAVALLVKDQHPSFNQLDAASGYQALIDFAPDFLKEFSTRAGLSEVRYWREAVSRAGEPRIDRKTIPIVGSLLLKENAERLHAILDYGLRDAVKPVGKIYAVAPQIKRWGATTLLRDLLTLVQDRLSRSFPAMDRAEMKSSCLYVGKPAAYIRRTFDTVLSSQVQHFPRSLEIFLVPGIAILATVHAPLGVSGNYPVPLGLASFDPTVVKRGTAYLMDRLDQYTGQDS